MLYLQRIHKPSTAQRKKECIDNFDKGVEQQPEMSLQRESGGRKMLQEARSSEMVLECSFTCVNIMFLVQFLEFHHLEEDMLKDMFGILLVLW